MKTTILLSILFASFLLDANLCAQTPTFEWASNLGANGNVYTRSMILDDLGNIYTIGSFNGGPIDFDPGAGPLELTSAGSTDIYLSKLDASGGFIWAKRFGGIDKEDGAAIAVDVSGNVYFTGYFNDVVDFDPGSGVYNLTSSVGGSNIFVCKLDVNGDFLWAKQIGNIGRGSSNAGKGIAIDAGGNVYVSGNFGYTVDFDPNGGTGTLTSNGLNDIFLCKFNASGVFQWVKQIGSTGQDYGQALTIDKASNLFLTGSFTDTVDFNPGAGVFDLMASTTGSNGFVLKLNASGDFVWATKLANGVNGNSIALDAPGNIYIGAGGAGIAIVKLNSTGNILWSKFLAGSNCSASSIAVDANGNVYTTGSFRNVVDFNPGTETVNFDSSSGWDSYINKFDASGDYVWAYQIGEPQFHDHGTAIALDASGNIYSYGHFRNTIDFDPGHNTFNLTAWSYDSYLLKWNQTTVGLLEKSLSEDYVVYPNPTDGKFSIKFDNIQKSVTVRILYLTGQVIMNKQFQNTNNIQLKINQPNGIYILETIDEQENKAALKIVKN